MLGGHHREGALGDLLKTERLLPELCMCSSTSIRLVRPISDDFDSGRAMFDPIFGRAICPSHKKKRFLWDGHLARPSYFCKRSNLLVLWLEPGNRYLESEPKPSEN